MAGEFFVIARDRLDLYQYFVDIFAEAPTVQVLWDRRVGERRCAWLPVATERRHAERRRDEAAAQLKTTGYVFVSAEASSSPIAR